MSHEDTRWILLVAVSIGEAVALLVLVLSTRLADWWSVLVALAEDGWHAFHDRFLMSASERQIAEIRAVGEAARREMHQLYLEYLHHVLYQPKGR